MKRTPFLVHIDKAVKARKTVQGTKQQHFKDLQLAAQGVVRHGIEREQVDPGKSFFRLQLVMAHDLESRIFDVSKIADAVFRILIRTELDVVRTGLFLENFAESLIVRTRNSHIDIIVPRNKALVTHGAQKRSAQGIISDIVFPANLLEVFQQVQLFQLQSTQGFIHD